MCIRTSPNTTRRKKKLPSKWTPRWMEPSNELLQFVHRRAQEKGPNNRVSLNLSNVQRITLPSFDEAVPMKETREIFEAICRSAESCAGILRTLNGGSLTIWAPTDRGALRQLLPAFQKFATVSANKGELHLLVPHAPYPRCDTAANILDLWRHELL